MSKMENINETVFERMKRMFPNRTDEEILRAIDNYDNREKVEEDN